MSTQKYDQTNGKNSASQQYPKNHSPAPSSKIDPKPDMSLSDAMDEFELMAKVSGKADKTIESYRYTYSSLAEKLGKDIPLGEISTKTIRVFLAGLMD